VMEWGSDLDCIIFCGFVFLITNALMIMDACSNWHSCKMFARRSKVQRSKLLWLFSCLVACTSLGYVLPILPFLSPFGLKIFSFIVAYTSCCCPAF